MLLTVNERQKPAHSNSESIKAKNAKRRAIFQYYTVSNMEIPHAHRKEPKI